MFFKKKRNKRKHQRQVVNWDAELEVTFPGFTTRMDVTIDNISMAGVRLACQEISVQGQHLVINDHPPELILAFPAEQTTMVVPVEISWYRRSTSKNLFEIGLGFCRLNKDQKSDLKNLLKSPTLL